MSLNVENLNKLITHLEAQPPEAINMAFVQVIERPECGTAGCILGHAYLIWPSLGYMAFDGGELIPQSLYEPPGWKDERNGVRRYPASRVIATLIRLRDHYLATGQVVVDWGPEPGEEPKAVWAPPKVIAPELPSELTRFLAEPVASVEV